MQEHHPLELAIIEDCFDSAIWKAKELLEKEREQIEKAYYRGKSDYKASRPLKSKQYYKEIYEKACHIEKTAIVNDKENSVSVNTTVVSEATENSKPKEDKELKSILKSPSLKKLNFDLASDSSLGYF